MKKNTFIMITVALISILTFAISLPFLPSEIPAHYNYLGEADRYGSKYARRTSAPGSVTNMQKTAPIL